MNESSIIMDEKETYGFKSGNAGPFIPEIQEFERKFWLMIKNIKFFDQPNQLQIKMKNQKKWLPLLKVLVCLQL